MTWRNLRRLKPRLPTGKDRSGYLFVQDFADFFERTVGEKGFCSKADLGPNKTCWLTAVSV